MEDIRLDNYLIFDDTNRKEVVKRIEQGNRRGNDIVVISLNKIHKSNVLNLGKEYYIYSDIVTVGENKLKYRLNMAFSEACYKSICRENALAKRLNQNFYIAVIINEQCHTFITRRELGNNRNCDIPLSMHAIYGEGLQENYSSIKNIDFIKSYLKLITENEYRTRHNSEIWYVHLPVNGVSHYCLFDSNFIEAIPKFDKDEINRFKGDLLYEYLTDTELYDDIVLIGTERYLAKKLMNTISHRYNSQCKLEVRISSPINKPSRLRILNDRGIAACKAGEILCSATQKKYYYDTLPLIHPYEIRNYGRPDLRKLLYSKLLTEAKKVGLEEKDLDGRLAVIERRMFELIKVFKDYSYEYIREPFNIEDIKGVDDED